MLRIPLNLLNTQHLPLVISCAALVMATAAFVASFDDARDRYLKAERVLWEQNYDKNQVDDDLTKATLAEARNAPGAAELVKSTRERRDVIYRRHEKALAHVRKCRTALFGE